MNQHARALKAAVATAAVESPILAAARRRLELFKEWDRKDKFGFDLGAGKKVPSVECRLDAWQEAINVRLKAQETFIAGMQAETLVEAAVQIALAFHGLGAVEEGAEQEAFCERLLFSALAVVMREAGIDGAEFAIDRDVYLPASPWRPPEAREADILQRRKQPVAEAAE